VLRRLGIAAVLLLGAITAGGGRASSAPSVAWEKWLHVPGVFDVAGPRADGRLVVAAGSTLKLVGLAGGITDFAPTYDVPAGPESYIALSSGAAVQGAACRFQPDDVFALDLRGNAPGVLRVSANGKTVYRFATVNGVSGLVGITFDTVGKFDHKLLVIGPPQAGMTQLFAIDCAGVVAPIGAPVPTALEGGIEVAPLGFGPYGGHLVAPNETDGSIYAVSPEGKLAEIAKSALPVGGDIGVESAGFVPPSGATQVLVSDRGTPGNPHPGTDSILRLQEPALTTAAVRPGDLLVTTEASAALLAVHCATTCTARQVATGPPEAHIEGRLLAIAKPLAKADTAWRTPAIVAGALVAAGVVVLLLLRPRRRGSRRRRGSSPPS
jgi:hypothetical protein